MKFGVFFQAHRVEEWKRAYINYCQLKKRIKVCCERDTATNGASAEPPHPHEQPSSLSSGAHSSAAGRGGGGRRSLTPSERKERKEHPLSEEDEEFLQELLRQLRRTGDFLTERAAYINRRWREELLPQIKLLPSTPSSSSPTTAVLAVGNFQFKHVDGAQSRIEDEGEAVEDEVELEDLNLERDFNDGQEEEEEEEGGGNILLSDASPSLSIVKEKRKQPRKVLTKKDPRKVLEKALLQFCYLLQVYEDFRINNEIASRKILKKFKKKRRIELSQAHELANSFFNAELTLVPKAIKKEVEEVFLSFFFLPSLETTPSNNKFNGNATSSFLNFSFLPFLGKTDKQKEVNQQLTGNWRRKAVERLWNHHPISRQKSSSDIAPQPLSSGVTSFLTGLSLPPLLAIFYTLLSSSSTISPLKSFILQIYLALSIPILFIYLFTYTLKLSEQYGGVNLILIFELDPWDRSLMPNEMGEMSAGLLALFSWNFALFCYDHILGWDLTTYPIILLCTIFLLLFYPFDHFNKGARIFLLQTFLRSLTSGVRMVQFRDFFFCDVLSSLTYSFVGFETLLCFVVEIPNGPENCKISSSWTASLVTALPAYFRLIQCFRRYYDSSSPKHLFNALKYILSLLTVAASLSAKFTGYKPLEYSWLILSFFTSSYAYYWDIKNDWGLLQDSRGLREEIAYSPYIYYIGMVENLVFRFTWVLLLSPNYWSIFSFTPTLVYTFAVLEVFRRCYWVLLRLEGEHSVNIGDFRVCKELPLPYFIGS